MTPPARFIHTGSRGAAERSDKGLPFAATAPSRRARELTNAAGPARTPLEIDARPRAHAAAADGDLGRARRTQWSSRPRRRRRRSKVRRTLLVRRGDVERLPSRSTRSGTYTPQGQMHVSDTSSSGPRRRCEAGARMTGCGRLWAPGRSD
jgi:hypothetical protein